MRLKNFVLKGNVDEIIYGAIGIHVDEGNLILDYGDEVTLEVPTGIFKDKDEQFRIPLSKARKIYDRLDSVSL